MNLNKSIKIYGLYIGSFLVPLMIVLGVFWSLNLAPFGNNSLLVSDLGTQYLPFLSSLKRAFEQSDFSFYSFSNVIGGPILPLAAYYLISPFNFLIAFFSYEALPIAILFIIALKIASMGLTNFYYLDKTYGKITPMTILFSTAFSLCGFVVAYSLNFMWLDALIFLPLITLGLQRLWDEKRYILYSASLFLAILTNYYLGYMLCIYAVAYSLYWFMKQQQGSFAKNIKSFFKSSGLFFVSSILTGISTSVILIPAIEGMLHTKKTEFDWVSFLPYPKFGLSFFSQMGIGSINFDLRLAHLPTIFAGIFILILSFAYFQTSAVPRKEKKSAAYLLLFIFLSFWIELISTVWHMFQSPAGFPYRNVFIFSFLMIKFAYKGYLAMKEKQAVLPLKIPIQISLLLLIGYGCLAVFNQEYILSWIYLAVSLGLVFVSYGLLRGIIGQTSYRKLLMAALFVLVCGELGGNYWIALKDIPFANQEKFAESYAEQTKIIEELSNERTDFYRLKHKINYLDAGYQEIQNGYNNGFLYGFSGMSGYTSTLDAGVQDSLNDLGLYEKNDRRIGYVDDSQVVNLLLNVGFQLTPEKLSSKNLLYSKNDTNVYKNQEAIGTGFLVTSEFGDIHLKEDQPLRNQEKILQEIRPSIEPYFQELTSVDAQNEDKRYVLKMQTTADGEVYFNAPEIKWDKVDKFVVNGQEIHSDMYIATNQLYNLGYMWRNSELKIEIYTKQKVEYSSWQIKTLNKNKIARLVEQLKQQSISFEPLKNDRLEGTVTVSDANYQTLYLSIPYDSDWEIRVDGRKTSSFAVLDNFTGIKLSEGTHKITMKYRSSSFHAGLFISLAAIGAFLLYQGTKFVIKRKQANQKEIETKVV